MPRGASPESPFFNPARPLLANRSTERQASGGHRVRRWPDTLAQNDAAPALPASLSDTLLCSALRWRSFASPPLSRSLCLCALGNLDWGTVRARVRTEVGAERRKGWRRPVLVPFLEGTLGREGGGVGQVYIWYGRRDTMTWLRNTVYYALWSPSPSLSRQLASSRCFVEDSRSGEGGSA